MSTPYECVGHLNIDPADFKLYFFVETLHHILVKRVTGLRGQVINTPKNIHQLEQRLALLLEEDPDKAFRICFEALKRHFETTQGVGRESEGLREARKDAIQAIEVLLEELPLTK